jgi:hypothetical protein
MMMSAGLELIHKRLELGGQTELKLIASLLVVTM